METKTVFRFRNAGSLVLVLALMLAMPFGPIGAISRAEAYSAPTSFADLAEQVKHSVANISTTQVTKGGPRGPMMRPDKDLRDFFGDDFFKHFFGEMPRSEMKTQALGSGVIVDKSGLILTNNHVVEKATEIKVKFDTGKEYTATVLGRDPKTDLALIKVKADGDFPNAVALGDSDAIRVGDWVMAVGNPFGLGQTVTTGVISAKGRVIGAGPYDDFLQTDAAINPGNSGGPLFDMQGRIVGINTAIIAQGQGIGFAIPINLAKELLPQLEKGKVVRGWLGLSIQDLNPELSKSFDVKDSKGVLVSGVIPDGPAQKAGLQEGDVVTAFNGKPVANAHMLSRLAAAAPPETKVTLDIVRASQSKSISVVLGTMPQQTAQAGASEQGAEPGSWGMTVQDLTPEIARQLGVRSKEKGVVISGVTPESAAEMAGLQAGDIIKEVNRQRVTNTSDFEKAVQQSTAENRLLLLLKRGEASLYVVLQKGASGE
ncbi:MAG: DegQ family serine endoprotease [Syntrophobacteraceae bacterium]